MRASSKDSHLGRAQAGALPSSESKLGGKKKVKVSAVKGSLVDRCTRQLWRTAALLKAGVKTNRDKNQL